MQPGHEAEAKPQSLAECEQPWNSSSTALGAATLVYTTSVPSIICATGCKARPQIFNTLATYMLCYEKGLQTSCIRFLHCLKSFWSPEACNVAHADAGASSNSHSQWHPASYLQDCICSRQRGIAGSCWCGRGLSQELAQAARLTHICVRGHVHMQGPSLLRSKWGNLRKADSGVQQEVASRKLQLHGVPMLVCEVLGATVVRGHAPCHARTIRAPACRLSQTGRL